MLQPLHRIVYRTLRCLWANDLFLQLKVDTLFLLLLIHQLEVTELGVLYDYCIWI